MAKAIAITPAAITSSPFVIDNGAMESLDKTSVDVNQDDGQHPVLANESGAPNGNAARLLEMAA